MSDPHDGWTPQPQDQVQPGDPWRDPDPPASEHIGCQFNHEHRHPECYDDVLPDPPAWESLVFERARLTEAER